MKKVKRFLAHTRALGRKARRDFGDFEVSPTGPRAKFSLRRNEPVETRKGYDIKDDSPFYESDSDSLLNYYNSYKSYPPCENRVLYVEELYLKTERQPGIDSNAVAIEQIRLVVEPGRWRLPQSLFAHGESAVSLFKEMGKIVKEQGEWLDETSLRIEEITGEGVIRCRKAQYFDQVATNLTLDWASDKLKKGWHTLRSGFEHPENGQLIPLSVSNLANTLGIAVMLYDKEGTQYLRLRSPNLGAISDESLHCTVSGVLAISPDLAAKDYDFSLILNGLHEEIERETGLSRPEYQIYPLVLARELPRGGKPQLFFAAVANVGRDRIASAMATAAESSEFVGTLDGAMDHTKVDVKYESDLYTYEGWAAKWYSEVFVDEYGVSKLV